MSNKNKIRVIHEHRLRTIAVFQHEGQWYCASMVNMADKFPIVEFDYKVECMIFRSNEHGEIDDYEEYFCDRGDEFSDKFLLSCVNQFLSPVL